MTNDNLMKRPCPNCNTARLWRGPALGAPGKVYCLECGTTFRLNLKNRRK